jgi:uncharacterized protein (TIGR03083 family)
VQVSALIDHLALNGPLLASAALEAGWDTAVPGTEWDVRTLVTHVGGVHRWATDIVATGSSDPDTAAGRAVGTGPGDGELIDWFRDGHLALLETLRAAPDELDCFTFLPAESPLHFWARRQAHETAIHRADAQAAAGDVVPFADLFAQDGIAELLHGFARRRANAVAHRATMGLDAVDGSSWLITFGGERLEAHETEDLIGTDVTVRGLSSDLYLWLWNRPSEAMVDGDEDVAASWTKSVRVRWT